MPDNTKVRFILPLFAIIFCVSSGLAQPTDSLSTADRSTHLLQSPRRTLYTFLYWQQESHDRPEYVAKTMQLYNGSREEKVQLAEKLRLILDSRGLLVDYDTVPSDPAYTDSLSGEQQYTLFPSLPEVYLVRNHNQWVFSKSSINAIPHLYSSTFSPVATFVINHLPDSMRKKWMGIQIWQYIAIFIWILIGLVLRKIFEFLFENYAQRFVRRTQTGWDDLLITETEKPVSFLFMMLFFWATFVNLMLPVSVNYYLSNLLEIAVLASFIWLFYNLINVLSQYLDDLTLKTESKLDDQLVPLIRKTLKVFIVVIGIIFILQNNGVNVTSLLAGLGLGGLAIALAAKDTLANFFGSVTIFTDQPFQVGDLIKTSNAEGVVEEVGFRSTRLRTLYDSVTSVPNSILANTEVDNLGLRRRRRLNTTLNLTYDTSPQQMEAFVEGIKAIITASEHINQENYEVHFNNYGAHSLDVMVYLFFEVSGWSQQLQLQHNFLLEVMRLAKEAGVEFAYPTQTLHVDSFHGDKPRKAAQDRSDEDLVSAIYAFGPGGKLSKPEGVIFTKNGKEVYFGHSKA